MAWPPGVLPVNRTDALSQQTTHPADHNAVNQAVNDIVAETQALTSGRAPRRSIARLPSVGYQRSRGRTSRPSPIPAGGRRTPRPGSSINAITAVASRTAGGDSRCCSPCRQAVGRRATACHPRRLARPVTIARG